MQIHLSSSDGVPIYMQIVNQVKRLVASGRLVPGEELPAIRVLSEQLLVNPNTVARAYLELEVGGIVTKRHGAGTYISESASRLSRREKLKVVAERVDTLLVEATHLDIPLEEVLELVRERHGLLHAQAKK